MTLRLALLLITALLVSHAVAQEIVGRLRVPVVYLKNTGQPTSRNIATTGKRVRILFETIPGRVTGSSDKKPIQFAVISEENVLFLDGNLLSESLHARARPLDAELRAAGLKIQPSETQLARLSAFAMLSEKSPFRGSTAFAERVDGPFIFAVYFDRKCTVRGKIVRDGVETEYALDIPGKGIWFLRSRHFSDKRRVFELAPTSMQAILVLKAP